MEDHETDIHSFCTDNNQVENVDTEESEFEYKLISWQNDKVTTHLNKLTEVIAIKDQLNPAPSNLNISWNLSEIWDWRAELNGKTPENIFNEVATLLGYRKDHQDESKLNSMIKQI